MKRALLAALIMLAVAVRVTCAQQLDSFKVYQVNDIQTEQEVLLKGQFDEQPIAANLKRIAYFANPVKIDQQQIKDKHRHLTWYCIDQPTREPLRLIEVENQYGKQRLTIGQPVFFLAPAEKKEPDSAPPTDLDFYKVYEVHQSKGVKPAGKTVDLLDQFGEDKQVEVRLPRYFAVPVETTIGDRTFPIQNAEEHLMIYGIREHRFELGQWHVEDEIDEQQLTIGMSKFLCVPSQKRVLELPEGLDHFQIYDVPDKQVKETLRFRGQFNRRGILTYLDKLTHFAVAAKKDDEDLNHEDAAFTLYRVKQLTADPVRIVQAWNQFGAHNLALGAAHYVMVPAADKGAAVVPGLDHYVCYTVVRPCSFRPRKVTLDDRLGEPTELTPVAPMLFCVPVSDGEGEINDKRNHLIIYRVDPQEKSDTDQLAVEDRFGEHDLDLGSNTMLAVPTLKFEVFPPVPRDNP